MSTIVYENAVQVAKSLLEAVRSIEEREAQSRAAVAKLSGIESQCNDANGKLGAANKTLRDVETQIAAKRAELTRLTTEADEVYEKKKTAEGQFNLIRTQMAELKQTLGA